jgi:hypothetical protein
LLRTGGRDAEETYDLEEDSIFSKCCKNYFTPLDRLGTGRTAEKAKKY